MEDFRITGDFHTHTTYSHGTGSVKDNVEAAIARGLSAVGISDHGFSHIAFGLRRKEFLSQRADIGEMRAAHPEIRIYHGIEANINGYDGALDLSEYEEGEFDIVLAGYHKFVKPNKFGETFSFHGNALYEQITKRPTAKMIVRNTDAYVKALEKRRIDVLTHINYGMTVDVKVVAECCAATKTLLELNGKRINLSKAEFETVLKTDVCFVINSDAHSPERVGDFSVPITFLKEMGADGSTFARIKNLNGVLSF